MSRQHRTSGNVLVEISFDRRARVHPRLHGAYRARVLEHGKLVDVLTIGIPRLGADGGEALIDEIAETALRYTLGDKPDLEVARAEDGTILMAAAS